MLPYRKSGQIEYKILVSYDCRGACSHIPSLIKSMDDGLCIDHVKNSMVSSQVEGGLGVGRWTGLVQPSAHLPPLLSPCRAGRVPDTYEAWKDSTETQLTLPLSSSFPSSSCAPPFTSSSSSSLLRPLSPTPPLSLDLLSLELLSLMFSPEQETISTTSSTKVPVKYGELIVLG